MKKLVILILLSLMAFCHGQSWLQFQFGPGNQGKTFVPAMVNMKLWTKSVQSIANSGGPTIKGDTVFVPTLNGLQLLSLDSDSLGCIPGSYEGVPVIISSKVVVSSNIFLRAFSSSSGESLWSLTFEDQVSHPTVWRDSIFITEGNRLHKVDADGQIIWTRECSPGFYEAAPAIDDSGRIFVVTLAHPLAWYDFRVYGFNQSGDRVFFYESPPRLEPEGNQVTPTITPLGLVLATYPDPSHIWFHGCYLVRFSGGAIRWEGTMGHSSAACDLELNRIYHVDGNVIVARDLTGNQIWRSSDLGTISYSSPAVDGEGWIFVGTDLGVFYVLGPDGGIRFHYDTGSGILTHPAISDDGRVLIASTSGQLHCFGYVVAVEEGKQQRRSVSCLLDGWYDVTGRWWSQKPLASGFYFRVQGGKMREKVVQLR